jgi:hypothetical protein
MLGHKSGFQTWEYRYGLWSCNWLGSSWELVLGHLNSCWVLLEFEKDLNALVWFGLVWFGLVLDHLNSCWNFKGLVCSLPCDAWSQVGFSDMGVQVCDYGAVVGWVPAANWY